MLENPHTFLVKTGSYAFVGDAAFQAAGSFAVWRRCSPDGEPTTGSALWIPASFKKLDQTFYTYLLKRYLYFFPLSYHDFPMAEATSSL